MTDLDNLEIDVLKQLHDGVIRPANSMAGRLNQEVEIVEETLQDLSAKKLVEERLSKDGVTTKWKITFDGKTALTRVTASTPINIGGADVHYHHVVTGDSSDLEDEDLDSAQKRLNKQIEQYFDLVAETLHHSPKIQDEAIQRLQKAKEMLHKDGDDPAWALITAEFEVKNVHKEIAKEQEAQASEKRLRWIVPVLVLCYVAIIVAIITFGGRAWTDTTEIPIVGVPVSVLVWAAIGSLAAILYRFYTHEPERITVEIRWLVARPIIGIIMGALVYLAILSGLFIFGGATGSDTNPASARPQLMWLVAFLGGFSDRFFETVINTVEGRFSRQAQEGGPASNQ